MKSGSEQTNELTSSAPLWIASRSLLAKHGAEFFSRWIKVAQGYQEDDVHDLRVASRRLREGLFLFAGCFPDKQRQRLAKKVKKVTRMLGDLRNIDEEVRYFAGLDGEDNSPFRQELQELLTALRRDREEVHKKLEEEFSALDPHPLQKDFHTISEGGNLFVAPHTDPFIGIASFAGEAICERADTVRELLPGARQEQASVAQHQLRIAVKKLRYRLELLAPLFGEPYQDLHRTLKEYQDLLGKLHDTDVFADLVQRRVPNGAGSKALLGVLAKRRATLFQEFTQQLQRAPLASLGDRARESLPQNR
ncbi:MAG TPA: CHAD domain-containing protein [Geomonas sp.]|nr:CHAD domain-containing protein [Geomonas sp.]